MTLIFHATGIHEMIQQIMVLKNISIMGGLLMVASFGAGAISLDGRDEAESPAGNLRAA